MAKRKAVSAKLPIGKKIKVNYVIITRDGKVKASVPIQRNGGIDSAQRFAGGRGGGNSPTARKRARISELKSLGQYRTPDEDHEYKRLTVRTGRRR